MIFVWIRVLLVLLRPFIHYPLLFSFAIVWASDSIDESPSVQCEGCTTVSADPRHSYPSSVAPPVIVSHTTFCVEPFRDGTCHLFRRRGRGSRLDGLRPVNSSCLYEAIWFILWLTVAPPQWPLVIGSEAAFVLLHCGFHRSVFYQSFQEADYRSPRWFGYVTLHILIRKLTRAYDCEGSLVPSARFWIYSSFGSLFKVCATASLFSPQKLQIQIIISLKHSTSFHKGSMWSLYNMQL